jgi:hypothetical protein
VSQFDVPRFAARQQGHCIAVDQADLPEIDGDDFALPIDGGAKEIDVAAGNLPADSQDDIVVLHQESVDSTGHVACSAKRTPHASHWK